MIIHVVRLAAALCFALGMISGANAAEPTGTWLTQNGDAHIRVAKCGIEHVRHDRMAARPDRSADRKAAGRQQESEPRLRNRKIIGLRIFSMAPDGNGGYAGSIYNADDGQTYRSKIVLRSAAQLEVQGCAGPLCGSEQWRKVGR